MRVEAKWMIACLRSSIHTLNTSVKILKNAHVRNRNIGKNFLITINKYKLPSPIEEHANFESHKNMAGSEDDFRPGAKVASGSH